MNKVKLGSSSVGKTQAAILSADAVTKLLSVDYDTVTMEKNLKGVANFGRNIAPVAIGTFVCYMIIPPVAGAAAFAVAGTGIAMNVYSLANVSVIGTGIVAVCDRIRKIT